MLLCPPATLIAQMAAPRKGSALMVGGRIAMPNRGRAYRRHLGAMLKDAGATHVILGHSERRTDHGETDAQVRAKAQAAHGCGPDRHRLHRRDRGAARRGPDAGR
jgi:triosephosphate isomerase